MTSQNHATHSNRGAVLGALGAAIAALVVALIALFAPITPLTSLTGSDANALRQLVMNNPDIIRDYLHEHPEFVIEALDHYQSREQERERIAQQEAAKENLPTLINSPAVHVAGNPQGDVVMVEFFDYNCTFCRASLPIVMDTVNQNPDLRFVMVEMPILRVTSDIASKAAIAARAQGEYLPFHIALMQDEDDLTEENVIRLARDMGLDADKLAVDMQSEETAAIMARNLEFAHLFKANGTPVFLVGDQYFNGFLTPEEFTEAIAKAREAINSVGPQASGIMLNESEAP